MALKDALKKIGGVIGDVAKTAFNAIPLVPNIPASSFSSPAMATVSGIASGLTDVLGKGALSLVPGGSVLKGAANIVSSLIPSPATKGGSTAASALPSAISTVGYVQNTLSGTTKGLLPATAPAAVPKTIGIAQQAAAPVQSTGNQIHVPVNSSGVGIFTADVPPVAVTQSGYVTGSAGLVAKSPEVGNAANLLPTSSAAEQIAEIAAKIAEIKNAPSNPNQQPQESWFQKNIVAVIGSAVALLFLAVLALKPSRR